jgi:hypothetical protein
VFRCSRLFTAPVHCTYSLRLFSVPIHCAYSRRLPTLPGLDSLGRLKELGGRFSDWKRDLAQQKDNPALKQGSSFENNSIRACPNLISTATRCRFCHSRTIGPDGVCGICVRNQVSKLIVRMRLPTVLWCRMMALLVFRYLYCSAEHCKLCLRHLPRLSV